MDSSQIASETHEEKVLSFVNPQSESVQEGSSMCSSHGDDDDDKKDEKVSQIDQEQGKGFQGNSFISAMRSRFRKIGTLIIVYILFGKWLYVASDSRLNWELKKKPTTENTLINDEKGEKTLVNDKKEETVCKKKNQIVYEHAPARLRLRIEEAAEKIVGCDVFLTGIAGNFEIAHDLCVGLKKRSVDGSENFTHKLLEEILEGHSKAKDPKKDTDTEFVLATPASDDYLMFENDFRVSLIDSKTTTPIMSDDLVCFGCGENLARDFILPKLAHINKENETELVELFRSAIYHVSKCIKTVGGIPVVSVTHVEECSGSLGKKLSTKYLKFASEKIDWDVTIQEDGIHISRDLFLAVTEPIYNVTYMDSKVEGTWIWDEDPIRQDLVTIRVYPNVTDPDFFKTSDYYDDTGQQHYVERDLVFNYNEDDDSFILGPGIDHANNFQDLRNQLRFTACKMFLDNDKNILVLWSG